MKRMMMNLILVTFILTFFQSCQKKPLYKDPKSVTEDRVEDLLKKMTLDEKLEQLTGTGDNGFDTKVNERLGIPAFKMTDGPLGVRWEKSTSFPSGVSIAASWDTVLISRFAEALAEETHAHGRNFLLGPCVNIHRLPTGGRNFESYGEDPYLASRLAVNYIKALQGKNVISSVKHFALNNQEWQRTEIDVQADERTMREIYLPSFEAAVKEGGVYTVMSAYNKVNGWWCSVNQNLLSDILKKDWGFKGFVISDWGSTHSTVNAANYGLDLEMPVAYVFSTDSLKKAIQEGKVSQEMINDKVRRILRVKFLAGLFDKTFPSDTTVLTGEAHKKLALEIAKESIVLLKNENDLLPLDINKVKKIAIIGPNATVAQIGGGSSQVDPYYSVSALDGIKKFVGSNAEIIYSQGDKLRTRFMRLRKQFLVPKDLKGNGLIGEFFRNKNLEGPPALTRLDTVMYFDWGYTSPASEIRQDSFSVRWSGSLIPPVTRTYTFVTASDDGIRLFIDGKKLIDNWSDHGYREDSAKMELITGKPYDIKLEYYENVGGSFIVLAWDVPVDKDVQNSMVADAVRAASNADVAIVFVGTSNYFEGEGDDRIGGLKLPCNQDELIKAVSEANPRTIVVLNTGTPVITDTWLGKVPVLLDEFFPGQEGGNAIAEILFGKHNPSGKLPFSFISGYNQTPAYKGYMDKSLQVPYSEGIFVGYRYLEKNKLTPIYPFGYGLSYTTFSYSELNIVKNDINTYSVTLKVKNTGKIAGSEIVQLYVADDHSKISRPVKELKGFSKVTLEPGQEKQVTMQLNSRSFAWYDVTKKDWKIEPGSFLIILGSSSADIRLKTNLLIKD